MEGGREGWVGGRGRGGGGVWLVYVVYSDVVCVCVCVCSCCSPFPSFQTLLRCFSTDFVAFGEAPPTTSANRRLCTSTCSEDRTDRLGLTHVLCACVSVCVREYGSPSVCVCVCVCLSVCARES